MVKHPQKELRSHLTGSATFVEDLSLSDQLHVGFLRSPLAHATITEVDSREARRVEGVVAVFTRPDLQGLLGPNVWREYPQAETEVVYQGQPVAAVVASRRLALEDSLERMKVSYRPLPVVSDPARAVRGKDKWLSTASSNVVLRRESEAGRPAEALKRSPHALNLLFHVPRISPYPIEGRGIAVEHRQTDSIVYSSTQSPHLLQQFLLGSTAEPRPVRVIQTAVGGAFGGKIFPYAEDLITYLISRNLRRNLKWIPLPEERLVTLTHRPDQTHDVQVGYDDSGRILAFRDRVLVDAGAFFGGSAGASLGPPGTEIGHGATAIDQMVAMATGPYAVKDVGVSVTAVATNKVMMGPIRGSGGMVATFILERVLNQIAMRLGLDQFSVRKANLVGGTSPDRSPFGASRPQLRSLELLERARNSRATQAVLHRASTGAGPTLRGFGLSFYLAESAPPSAETVRLELTKSGKLLLFASVAPTGQGSERTLAAIISRKLHPGRSPVEVLFGDTTTSRLSIGTQSSRSITYAGSAALMACPLLVGRIEKSLAGSARGRITSVTFSAGSFHLRYRDGDSRELDFVGAAKELGAGVAVEATYRSESSTFSLGCHISLAEVDRSTGSVRVLQHLTFDDFGTVLDPSALVAQSEGGTLQSIGEALQEEVGYDQCGQLVGSYVIPSALAKPKFSHTPIRLTTSQHLHGARGAGEAGRIGSLPAMVNAVENALSKARREVFLASTPMTDEPLYAILSGG